MEGVRCEHPTGQALVRRLVQHRIASFRAKPPANNRRESRAIPPHRLPVCMASHGDRGEAGGAWASAGVDPAPVRVRLSVLGRTQWMCRIGWVPPRRGFWIYSFFAGAAAAAGVWSYAMMLHQSLGRVPPPHRVLLSSASGPLIEEMLFRGILFWLILEFLRRRGASRLAAVCATVVLTAILFALSHNDRNVPRLFATIVTGVSFGWMRAQSGSTAAAALMHAVYNFVLSSIATF